MSYKLVVEFENKKDAKDFQDAVNSGSLVDASRPDGGQIYIVGVSEYNPNVSNSIQGSASNVMQCGKIEGGVNFGSSPRYPDGYQY